MTETLWPLDPQTRGKHLVLRQYLNAWLPIMGMRKQRILFIDGFAGPGEYNGGEEGSPIIALRALSEHHAKGKIQAEIRFIFIEKDKARVEHLSGVLEDHSFGLPENCHIEVISAAFDETLTEVVEALDAQGTNLAPSFVMIDPFGVSDTPMSVIERIFRNRGCEVFVSFMYEAINRFKTTPEFARHLDSLFGCATWRDGIEIEDKQQRKDFFYGLYEQQLRNAGASYVVRVELYHENRLVYAIFFGTKHPTGCDRMKQAIWNVVPSGDFAFRGTRAKQLIPGLEQPDFGPLRQQILDHFADQGWGSVDTVENFVSCDQTDYHSGQYKRVLRELEEEGILEADEDTRRRRKTHPPGTRLRFRTAD